MASTKAKPETTTKPENNNTTTKEEVAVIENSVAHDSETINDQREHPILEKIGNSIRELCWRIMTVFKYLLVPHQKTHLLNCSLKNQLFFGVRKLYFF